MTWSSRRKGTKRRGWSGEGNGEDKPSSFRATNAAVSYNTIQLSAQAGNGRWDTEFKSLLIMLPNALSGAGENEFAIELANNTGILIHDYEAPGEEKWVDLRADNASILRAHFSGSAALSLPVLDPETSSNENFLDDDSVIFWLNKTTHKLLIKVKYSNGTFKTAEIALT